MKPFFILLLLTSTTAAIPAVFQPSARAINRRQSVSYTNSVIHQNPKHPDQTAESTVKVSINTHPDESDSVHQSNFFNNYKKTNRQPQHQSEFQTMQHQPQEQQQQQQSQNHQMFNVGYSVRFTNSQQAQQPQPQPSPSVLYPQHRQHFEDGEIITGTKKINEEVQKPSFSTQEYVTTALEKKPKYPKINKLQQEPIQNQKFIKTLEQINLNQNKLYQHHLQQQQLQFQQQLQQQSQWKNEYQTAPVKHSQFDRNYQPVEHRNLPHQQQFDHAKALGRGQNFDHSNAVGIEEQQKIDQANMFYYKNNPQTITPQQQQQQQPSFINPQHFLQSSQPKLPVDTRLLKEPVLTTDPNAVINDPSTIPIHVDTRLLQEAMRGQFTPEQQQQLLDNYLQSQQPQSQQPQQIPTQQQKYYQDQDFLSQGTKYQYKMYGKPQPVTSLRSNYVAVQRQPRYSNDIQTNLRPPPLGANAYQRRIYLG